MRIRRRGSFDGGWVQDVMGLDTGCDGMGLGTGWV